MKKAILVVNIVFVLNLMKNTSYGWYIFMDLVIIGLNAYLLFQKED